MCRYIYIIMRNTRSAILCRCNRSKITASTVNYVIILTKTTIRKTLGYNFSILSVPFIHKSWRTECNGAPTFTIFWQLKRYGIAFTFRMFRYSQMKRVRDIFAFWNKIKLEDIRVSYWKGTLPNYTIRKKKNTGIK